MNRVIVAALAAGLLCIASSVNAAGMFGGGSSCGCDAAPACGCDNGCAPRCHRERCCKQRCPKQRCKQKPSIDAALCR